MGGGPCGWKPVPVTRALSPECSNIHLNNHPNYGNRRGIRGGESHGCFPLIPQERGLRRDMDRKSGRSMNTGRDRLGIFNKTLPRFGRRKSPHPGGQQANSGIGGRYSSGKSGESALLAVLISVKKHRETPIEQTSERLTAPGSGWAGS